MRVDFSVEKMKERVAKAKSYKMSKKKKKVLLEYEKSIPLQSRKFKKPGENRVFFNLELKPKLGAEQPLGKDTIEECLKEKQILTIFNIVEEVWKKPFHMTTCATYEYKFGKYKPIGGFPLPTQIPLPAELGTKFGKSEIGGISIRFDESTIGLENIRFDLEDDKSLAVSHRASYEVTAATEMLRKGWELSDKIASFLVEKVK